MKSMNILGPRNGCHAVWVFSDVINNFLKRVGTKMVWFRFGECGDHLTDHSSLCFGYSL